MRESEAVANAFAAVLRDARKEAEITQEDLAHRSGLDRTTISQAELGKASPRLETLIRLAGALNKDPRDLVPDIRWQPPTSSPTPKGHFRAS